LDCLAEQAARLAARGETPPAFGAPNAAAALGTPFGRRCIPAPPHGAQSAPWGPRADCVAPPSNIPDIAPHRAQDARWGPRSSVVTPCQPGASPPSVPRRTFTTDCWSGILRRPAWERVREMNNPRHGGHEGEEVA